MSACFQRKTVAQDYLKYRPSYSPEVAKKIVDYLGEKYTDKRQLAIDVGCGSGQLTQHLAPHFAEVIGLDISEAQIAAAKSAKNPENISYRVGRAENLPVADNSVSLITSATASHYFDWDVFGKEVDRVLKPGGCMVVVFYDLVHISHSDADVEKKLKECVIEFADYSVGTTLSESTPEEYYILRNMHKQPLPLPYTEQKVICVDCYHHVTVAEFIECNKTYANIVMYIDDHPESSRFDEFGNSLTDILKAHSGQADLKPEDAQVTTVYTVHSILARKPTSSNDQA